MRLRLLLAAGLAVLGAGAAAHADTAGGGGVLERAKASGELRIGFRADTRPFAFKDEQGVAQGYSVDLCRAVGRDVAVAVGRPDLRVIELEVTAQDRLDAVAG